MEWSYLKVLVLFIFFSFLLFLAGCNSVPTTRHCGSGTQCLNEAIASCNRATASVKLSGGQVESGEIQVSVRPSAGKGCHIGKSISKIHFQEKALRQYLHGVESPLPVPRAHFVSFVDGSIDHYARWLDLFAEENLPINACSFKTEKETTPASSLRECDENIEKETKKLLSRSLQRVSRQVKLDLKASEEKAKSLAITRSELGIADYEYAAEKTDLFSGGVCFARMLAPGSASGGITGIDLNSLSVKYSLSSLPAGSFAVVEALGVFNEEMEAKSFFSQSLKNLRSTGIETEKASGFHGKNSVFLQAVTKNSFREFMVAFVEKKWLLLVGVVSNDANLEKVLGILERASNNSVKKINPESESVKLNCMVSSKQGEACSTVKEPEQYEEKECSQRPFRHKSSVVDGGVFTGLFGGCRAWLKVQVFNEEEKSGSFALTVNFTDSNGGVVATRQESKTIQGNSSAQFEVEYTGECRKAVKDYNYSVEAPGSEFCETVTKTRLVETKKCKPSQEQEIKCG